MSSHDSAYKFLFSHPQAVADLLRGFVREDWVQLLDFSSLEKVSGSYVSDDLRDREDDVIWRLRLCRDSSGREDWLYLYLLLEFQSSVVPQMALRIMTYLGLLYQDLIQARACHPERLPPVFPLVLYNGRPAWTAAEDVAELIETGPAGLARYRPQLRYALIDEGRLPLAELERTEREQADNSVSSLFQIERSASPREVAAAVARLTQKLQGPEYDSLRRAFTVWINRLILRRFTPDPLPDLQDLPEVNTMIAEQIDDWTQQLLRQGMAKGMEQGRHSAQSLTLQRLLTRRFGPLPAEILARISGSDEARLQDWLDQVLDAPSLQAMFPPG